MITVHNLVKDSVARSHIELHTGMSPRWIEGVCVYFNMILFTVPNSQIAFNKQMSTVNFYYDAIDYRLGQQIFIL